MSLEVDIQKKLENFELNVKFNIASEEGIAGILGSSGCGKSMCLKCIAGIEIPDRGRIVLNEKVLFDSDRGINMKIQERNIGYLFQNYALFPHLTVGENIRLGAGKSKNYSEIRYYINLFKLEKFVNVYPKKLSGGQQQRVALARMLISNPDLIMLDEPFSALDSYLKEWLQLELYEIIGRLQKDVIMVTHNRDEIYRFCEKIHILEGGELVSSGYTGEVFREPKKIAAAKLTGCKNILPIERIDKHKIYIRDFQSELYFSKEIPEEVSHIGIRAHHLRPARDSDRTNVVICKNPRELNDPFERVFVFENDLWWKIGRDTFSDKYGGVIPDKLYISEDSVFFLE